MKSVTKEKRVVYYKGIDLGKLSRGTRELRQTGYLIPSPNALFTSRSPLRYPGGKTRAVQIITRLIPSDTKEMCSPFFGGGSIELHCAAKGILVRGYDIFNPLVEFWQCLTESPALLADEVERYFPLPKAQFYHLQQSQVTLPSRIQRAAAFYVLNRSSFSGATLSGGMSPDHPRFTRNSILRLREFYNPNFIIEELDFRISIPMNSDRFLYLDPPYLINSKLYGRNGDAHKDFDHEALRELIVRRDNWILSYNNSPAIVRMYRGFKILYPNWTYGMSNDKRSKEILVVSKTVQRAKNI